MFILKRSQTAKLASVPQNSGIPWPIEGNTSFHDNRDKRGSESTTAKTRNGESVKVQ